MVKLSPKAKFILITVDDLLLVPLVILVAYYFFPDLLLITTVVTILGVVIYVPVKYRFIIDSLKDGTYYLYEIVGTKCNVIETVTPTSGKVKIGAEIWEARCDNGEILAGTKTVIVSRESLIVHVNRSL